MFVLSFLSTMMIPVSFSQLWFNSERVSFPSKPGEVLVKTYSIRKEREFNEVIASWNVDHPAVAAVKVEVRGSSGDHKTGWYTLADWAADARLRPRVSVAKQKDADGVVYTDTLKLSKATTSLDVRLSLTKLSEGATPELKLIAVSLLDNSVKTEDEGIISDAWGRSIEVPRKEQGKYPNGGVLCSATSLSMLMNYWGTSLQRNDLLKDVPEVQAGVWDTVYKGAGNWPFNTAYAGSFEGMIGYVSRLRSIADAEKWVLAGIPIACSVSYDMLRGRPLSATESGHLVVLVGFTSTGDPILNDPAFPNVRRSYKRSDFEKGWLYSKRTVYIVHPVEKSAPNEPGAPWIVK